MDVYKQTVYISCHSQHAHATCRMHIIFTHTQAPDLTIPKHIYVSSMCQVLCIIEFNYYIFLYLLTKNGMEWTQIYLNCLLGSSEITEQNAKTVSGHDVQCLFYS